MVKIEIIAIRPLIFLWRYGLNFEGFVATVLNCKVQKCLMSSGYRSN